MVDFYFIIFLTLAVILGLIIIGVAIWYFGFKRRDEDVGPGYTVAMSNRLFKVYYIIKGLYFKIHYFFQIHPILKSMHFLNFDSTGKFHAQQQRASMSKLSFHRNGGNGLLSRNLSRLWSSTSK